MNQLDVVQHAALVLTGIQILLHQLFNHTLDTTSNPEYNIFKEFRFQLRCSAIVSIWLSITVAAARYMDVNCELYLVVVFSGPGIIAATRLLIAFILLCQLSSTESGKPVGNRRIKRIIPCSSTVPDYMVIKRRSAAIFVGVVLAHLACAGVAIYLRFRSYELGADSSECTMDKEMPMLMALFVISMALLGLCLLVFACKTGEGFGVAIAYIRISTVGDLLTLSMFLTINMNEQLANIWSESGFTPDIWGILFSLNQVLIPFVVMPIYNWLFVRRSKISRCCNLSCCPCFSSRGRRGKFEPLREDQPIEMDSDMDIDLDGHDPSDDEDDAEEEEGGSAVRRLDRKNNPHAGTLNNHNVAMYLKNPSGNEGKTVLIPQKSWILNMREMGPAINNSIDLFRKGAMEISDTEVCWLTCYLIQDALSRKTIYSGDILQAKLILRSILKKTDPHRSQSPITLDKAEKVYCKALAKTYGFSTFAGLSNSEEVSPLEVEMLVREIAFVIALSCLQNRPKVINAPHTVVLDPKEIERSQKLRSDFSNNSKKTTGIRIEWVDANQNTKKEEDDESPLAERREEEKEEAEETKEHEAGDAL